MFAWFVISLDTSADGPEASQYINLAAVLIHVYTSSLYGTLYHTCSYSHAASTSGDSEASLGDY